MTGWMFRIPVAAPLVEMVRSLGITSDHSGGSRAERDAVVSAQVLGARAPPPGSRICAFTISGAWSVPCCRGGDAASGVQAFLGHAKATTTRSTPTRPTQPSSRRLVSSGVPSVPRRRKRGESRRASKSWVGGSSPPRPPNTSCDSHLPASRFAPVGLKRPLEWAVARRSHDARFVSGFRAEPESGASNRWSCVLEPVVGWSSAPRGRVSESYLSSRVRSESREPRLASQDTRAMTASSSTHAGFRLKDQPLARRTGFWRRTAGPCVRLAALGPLPGGSERNKLVRAGCPSYQRHTTPK